jgi:hypothetical protein
MIFRTVTICMVNGGAGRLHRRILQAFPPAGGASAAPLSEKALLIAIVFSSQIHDNHINVVSP